jgi:hypothetical protein
MLRLRERLPGAARLEADEHGVMALLTQLELHESVLIKFTSLNVYSVQVSNVVFDKMCYHRGLEVQR